MTTEAITSPETMDEWLDQLGDIPLGRVLRKPPPGTATEADLRAAQDQYGGRIFELIDGTLVEKAVGFRESFLGGEIFAAIRTFVRAHRLGKVLPADGAAKLMEGLIRAPDVSFYSWDRFPDRKFPTARVPEVYPDLAIEVLSESNTPKEMQRKVREFFFAGTKLIWHINPKTETADVYTAPDEVVRIDRDGILDGGTVLPGFRLRLGDVLDAMNEDSGSS